MIEVLWLYCWLALCVQNIISRILPISSFTAIMMNSIEVKHCSLCFHNGEPEEFYRWGNVYTTWWCNDAWSIDDASCSLIKIACFSDYKWCILNWGWCFYYVSRFIFSLQLSQLEDPRRPSGDLPCAAQVRLQPLRRHRRCRPHPQVAFHVIESVPCAKLLLRRYCPLNKDGTFSYGASLPQLKTRRNAAGNFSSRRFLLW